MSRLEELGIEPDPVIELYKRDVDRSLIRENLKLTVTERLEKLTWMLELIEEMRDAGNRKRSQE
jgi:hypothetical protein